MGSDDCVDVDLQTYDVSKRLAGQSIALVVDAQERSFTVWQGTTPVALLPIKGLFDAEVLPFEQYAQMMQREAQSQLQRLRWQRRTLYQPSLWTFWSQLTRKQAERAQRETGSRTTSQCSFATLESLMLS